MNPHDVLEASIGEPPPPFPGIDGLIARERRRHRARRSGTALAGTAGVVAVILGVTLVTGGGGRTSGGPQDPSSAVAASIPADETDAARYARLSALLRARVDAVLPGAALTSANPAGGLFGSASGTTYAGYDLALAGVQVTAPQGSMDLSVFVLRPLVVPRPQPTGGVAGRLFGGCAGDWSTSTPGTHELDRCDDRVGPGGTAVSVAERYAEEGSARVVTVAFPDGGVVTVWTELAATLLSPDELIEVAADPGFVAGSAAPPPVPATVDPTDPQALRDLPAEPAIGTVYPFDLYTHCGVDLVPFAGRAWRAEPPDDGTLPGPYLAGTIELLDHGTARFVVDQRHAPGIREVIMFYWQPGDEQPVCD